MIAQAMPSNVLDQRRLRRPTGRARTVLRLVEGPMHDSAEDLDALMLRIARSGDRQAFQALFLALAPKVKAYLLRHGAASGQAEDLAQEALLTVWRKAALFDPARASVSAWVFTIARNLRIDTLRRERSAVAYALALPEPEPQTATPATEHEEAQRSDRVRQAITTLPAEQLEVIRLSFFADKAHAEIASELALPLGTVKSRLRLALAKLRGLVGDLQ